MREWTLSSPPPVYFSRNRRNSWGHASCFGGHGPQDPPALVLACRQCDKMNNNSVSCLMFAQSRHRENCHKQRHAIYPHSQASENTRIEWAAASHERAGASPLKSATRPSSKQKTALSRMYLQSRSKARSICLDETFFQKTSSNIRT